ncbi:MAG: dihydrolipoamide acetyltransferase family protein [Myxococcota bacterium]
MRRFELPDIGEGMVEAEILDWKVQEGELVKEDQILVELLTDKAEIEIPSPYSGRVHRLCYQVGEIAPVGAVLVEIEEEGSEAEAPPVPAAPTPRVEPPPRIASRPAPDTAPHPPVMPERPRSRQKASERPRGDDVEAVPAVRELARRLGVDLRRVGGTGPGGRIMRRDVESFRTAGPPAEPPAERVSAPAEAVADPEDWERRPFRGLRRAIARRMVQSRRTAAHFTYVEEVDLTDLLARIEEHAGSPRSPLAYIAHATVRSLAATPVLNASIDDEREEIVLKGKVHLGIATATDEGLLVPVIREAAELDVRELASAIEALAEKARESRLAPGELRGSTFTITSLGKLGGVLSTPILNYPEVAILSVGAIRSAPAVRAGELVERRVLNLSISVDHRIADGLVAARFIQDLKQKLESVDFPGFSHHGSEA